MGNTSQSPENPKQFSFGWFASIWHCVIDSDIILQVKFSNIR